MAKQAAKKSTLTDRAMAIVSHEFANKVDGVSPRLKCLERFEKELKMTNPNKRQTYFNNTMVKLRTEQQAEAEARAEAGKPVWTVFKVAPGTNVITSAGLFTSATAAKQFNETFDHHGVARGAFARNERVDEKFIKIPSTARGAKKAVAKKATRRTTKKAA